MDWSSLFSRGAALWIPAALIAVIGYFCGCLNGAVIASRYILKDDVRRHGSGNAGLTNFCRTYGWRWAYVVLLADIIKAVAAVLLGAFLTRLLVSDAPVVIALSKYWAGLFCLLGHMFPCMFGFKGGKGILSGGTAAIFIDYRIALVVWGGFLLLLLLTRWVSLGSCFAGAAFPVVSALVFRAPPITALSVVCGGLILWQHRSNIGRLARGEESKFSIHPNAAPSGTDVSQDKEE